MGCAHWGMGGVACSECSSQGHCWSSWSLYCRRFSTVAVFQPESLVTMIDPSGPVWTRRSRFGCRSPAWSWSSQGAACVNDGLEMSHL